ncbi:hypothetical protein COV42_02045 [Candidatus Campbellbacteria bacterium CG11_big_fil_rev_8_21_14_0_20_44_21]|uniref:DUF721 domain-containing protein n=1 Tax=Candidatus Campbellbacteria bacterium CG22_combo_CG10-13_8_21_14_all_43_18 TaxID=1974530 RepID=A0A2H0DWJ4_9BACT|nr:MAG: hypothetical protein COW82_02580 [Candidatus Campbellbacteria bacterium CG22_combo_CG10-13_8_21_14_all_43_18]PIR24209.1 MAG: hypothetical protein COV42_02045 [Candidatus Campbellbacteria bacterium CG11_big_fil_rev_8_21_14_0_20_44_21]
MSFINLKNFLGKFEKLSFPDDSIRTEFVSLVREKLRISVSKEQVSFDKKTGVLYLKTKGLNKSVFFLQKEELLKNLNERLGKKELVKDLMIS